MGRASRSSLGRRRVRSLVFELSLLTSNDHVELWADSLGANRRPQACFGPHGMKYQSLHCLDVALCSRRDVLDNGQCDRFSFPNAGPICGLVRPLTPWNIQVSLQPYNAVLHPEFALRTLIFLFLSAFLHSLLLSNGQAGLPPPIFTISFAILGLFLTLRTTMALQACYGSVLIRVLTVVWLFSNLLTFAAATTLPTALWSTFRTTTTSDTVSFDTFYPKSNFTTYGLDGFSIGPENSFANTSLENAARTFLRLSGMTDNGLANIVFDAGFTNGEFGYAYFSQFARVKGENHGTLVRNTRINVAFKGDKVTAYGTSRIGFTSKTHKDFMTDEQALTRFASPELATKLNAKPPVVGVLTPCLLMSFDPLQPLLVLRTAFSGGPFENAETGARYEAYIDAITGDFLGAVDFVSHLPFTVVPATKKGMNEGLVTFPKSFQLHDPLASPIGWTAYDIFHSTKATAGNNVAVTVNSLFAQEDKTLQFDRVYDESKPLDDPDNKAAAGANAFYVMNVMHDMTYRYGFTEDAFNFQFHNWKQTNASGDADQVLVSIHDARGHLDGPRFMTPPDGESPHCYLPAGGPGAVYSPGARDAAMDNTVLIHEYAHGVTNRLVGGGTARCLQTFEASGLGEGFSDAMADWMAQDAALTKDFVVGAYFSNSALGMRRYPYSTNSTINPLKYSDIRGNSSITVKENDIGEIWANILHNVYAALVEEFHFSPNKLRAPDSEQGNVVFMRIFMDALSLLPCNPTVLQARDAWIQADTTRYGGVHVCTMYKAFASRGLGVGADEATYTGDDKVPDDCNA